MKDERINEILSNLQDKLDDENKALISDDIATLIAENETSENEFNKISQDLLNVKERNSQLIETNGKLMLKIGVKEPEKEIGKKEEKYNEISFTDLFDSKRSF